MVLSNSISTARGTAGIGVTVGVSVTDFVGVRLGIGVMVGISEMVGVSVMVGVRVKVAVGGWKLYIAGSMTVGSNKTNRAQIRA